jgi:hypothetical protein
MSYFNKDPASMYKDIEANIPSIKNKNKNFMNNLHGLNMSSDFWWALSGEYAILAEYVMVLSIEDSRFLNDLKNTPKKTQDILSSAIINSIGRESILDKNFSLNNGVIKKKNIDEILIDGEKHFITNDNDEKNIESLPLIYLTNFLNQLRLKEIKSLYIKIESLYFRIKKKIKSFYQDIYNNYRDKILYSNGCDKDFESALRIFLPDDMGRYFPKWFMWLSNYIVKPKHKWKTFFGVERNIYQKILLAKSYQKYGDNNISIISHGSVMSVNFWHLWRFSLFPNMKIKINTTLNLPKIPKQNISEDILFCAMQLPFVGDHFYIQRFWDFMEVHKSVIKLLINGLKNGKKIKIRYKNFYKLIGYAGPFTHEECKIPNEEKRFEDVYNKYKLIVCMPFGSIATKCYQNNINCISYNHPYTLTNKQAYLSANTASLNTPGYVFALKYACLFVNV